MLDGSESTFQTDDQFEGYGQNLQQGILEKEPIEASQITGWGVNLNDAVMNNEVGSEVTPTIIKEATGIQAVQGEMDAAPVTMGAIQSAGPSNLEGGEVSASAGRDMEKITGMMSAPESHGVIEGAPSMNDEIVSNSWNVAAQNINIPKYAEMSGSIEGPRL